MVSSKVAPVAAAIALAFALSAWRRRRGTPHLAPPPATMRAVLATPDKRLVIESLATPTPAASEILIRVHATAVNRLDTVQRRGLTKPPPGVTPVLGLECAGTVVAVGTGVSKFRVGDEVLSLLSGGSYAEYAVASVQTTMKKPRRLSFAEAASIPEAWLTAFQLVHLVAQVRAGEAVLIHAAASSVGLAAIQLVREAGAIPIVTVGSHSKLDLCLKLGAVGGAIRHEGPWLERVRTLVPTAAESRGFDVILDCVAGSYAEQNLAALAVDGRWVLYSSLGGPQLPEALAPTFLKALMLRRIQLLATTLRARPLEYKSHLTRRFAAEVLPRIGSTFTHIIDREYPSPGLEAVEAAHASMERNENAGKIVIHVVSESLLDS